MPALIAVALLLLLAGPVRAQPADPAWQGVWDYLVQSVCTDATGRPIPGQTPLDACPRRRTAAIGDRLPYHKRDWPGDGDRDSYQQSDSIPIQTRMGPAVLHTYDFGDGRRRFGEMDEGDGGQIVFFTPYAAAIGVTEDGGAGLQLFLGPSCRPIDSWVVVDRSFVDRPAGQTVARLTRSAARCAVRLNSAFTQWRITPVTFRTFLRGRAGEARWDTLISDHYDADTGPGAKAMERMYFTKALGYTRWEAWRNQNTLARAEDRLQAGRLQASGRCAAADAAPGPGWLLVDCREWTRLVSSADPAGDPPFVWLERLRTAPATATLFGP